MGWDQVDGGSGNDSWSANWSDVAEAISLDLNASNTTLTDGRYVKNVERLEEFKTGAGVYNDVVTLNRNASIGTDTVFTQDGSDTVYVFGGTTKDDTAADAVYMGAGADDHLVVDWSGLTEAAYFDGDYDSGVDGYSSTSTIGGYTRLYHYGVERYTVTTGSGNDTIETGANQDVISSGAGNDTIRSGADNDTLSGGEGNDWLEGGAGNDALQGGTGDSDIAVFTGLRADYRFALHRDGTIGILDGRNTGDGQDNVEGIEFLQFWDGTVRLTAVALEDQSVGEDGHWSFQLPEELYSDQGAGLEASISLADGTGLPEWLTFNAETRTLSGTPPLNFNGIIDLAFVVHSDTRIALSNLRLIVEAINDAPVAAVSGNTASGTEDTVLTGKVPGGRDVEGNSLTYELVAPVAGLSFAADGRYSYTPAANFYGTVSFAYQVVDDAGAKSAPVTFFLSVASVNDAPSDILLSNAAVAENAGAGTPVGSLTALDLDGDSAFTFSLLNNAGGRFALGADGKSIEVKNALLLDYEQATSHQVVVRATDGNGASYDETVTIALSDVPNENTGGTSGNDTVSSGSGSDNLSGGAGNDVLSAGGGKDKVNGGTGNDRIIGGAGQDSLTGGSGKDIFAFAAKDTGTSKKTADYITDFSGKGGDRIDLKLIDADVKKKGDQAFSFIGKNAFTKAGQVSYEKIGRETYVYLNTDSDKAAEGVIKLKGAIDFSKGWFVL